MKYTMFILIILIGGLHFTQAQQKVKSWQQPTLKIHDDLQGRDVTIDPLFYGKKEVNYNDSGWVTPPFNDTTGSFLEPVNVDFKFDVFHDNSITMEILLNNMRKTHRAPITTEVVPQKHLSDNDTVDYMADTVVMDFLFFTRACATYHRGFMYLQVFDTIRNGACIVSAVHNTKPQKGQVPANIYEPLPILSPGYYRIRADHYRNQKIKMYLVYKT
jgi:hypothetical protein